MHPFAASAEDRLTASSDTILSTDPNVPVHGEREGGKKEKLANAKPAFRLADSARTIVGITLS